jgi:hypothetical protein
VLAALKDADLTLVVDEPPDFLSALNAAIPCRVITFSDRRYARALLESDVIISPKRLVNAYELAHTEYKITLGMAVGLPALASPQQSYIEAIGDRNGGIVAASLDDWRAGFERLRNPAVRADMGRQAQQTVLDRYATPVVAGQYCTLLKEVVVTSAARASVS